MRLPVALLGTPEHVGISDVAALPIRLGAAMRHRRLFHPEGVLAEGTLERVAAPGEGLPIAVRWPAILHMCTTCRWWCPPPGS